MTDTSKLAFPVPGSTFADGAIGMTLREYIATHALVGLIATPEMEGVHAPAEGYPKLYASMAVKYADALLEKLGEK